jgi:hypothetical protein
MEKLKRLKQALQDENQLSRIADVFWDEVAGQPWFASAGHPAENPRLRAIAERAALRVLGGQPRVTATMFIHIPAHAFWHGCCAVSGKLAQIFYFQDIDSGLLTMAGEVEEGHTHFVRFSAVDVELDGKSWPGFGSGTPSA